MTELSNNKTSILIKSQVPAFVRDEHGLFVEFLESYYHFLEQDGQLSYVTKNFLNFLDIDIIYQDIISEDNLDAMNDYHQFLQKFYDNFATKIPDSLIANKTLLLKHAKEFYRSRGSEKSIRFLMRALYNEEVEFYYPKNDILRASDGKWFIERSLNVRDFAVNNVANATCYTQFRGRSIRGAQSNSTCTVETVDQYYDNGTLVTELKISAVEQDFINGEKIFTFFEENGEVKHLSCNLFSGIIINTTVTNPGSGYIQGASVPIESNSGSGGIVIISKVVKANLDGKIKSVLVTLPGAGFRVNDPLLFTGGGGKNAAAQIFSVNEDETFHPSSYNIVGSRIIDIQAQQVANTTDPNEGFAYSNLATQYVNTTNLTISTIPGSFVTDGTLSGALETSNVYFETGDKMIVSNVEYYILETNRYGTNIRVNPPGLPGGLTNETITVIKKPNANTTMANSMIYWTYANCGPIVSTIITNPGQNYVELPTVDVQSNSFIRAAGILGRMEIVDGGTGYQNGDQIEFINQPGDYGHGANAVVSLVDANGVIQQVTFYSSDGDNPGGLGYSLNFLPRANVITTTGNGANIMVTAIIADGELLEATSNVIGSIERLKVLSGGAGYLTNPTLNLASQGDGTAKAIANIVTGIFTYPGRYINDDGHLSGYNFIQDRDYYQPHSYVIKSKVATDKYRKVVKELTHPAGTKMFGQFVYSDQNQQNVSANVVNTLIYTSNSYANLVVRFSRSNTLSFIPTGNYAYLTFDRRIGAQNTRANLSNVYYDTQNIWYNAANTKQYAVVKGNTYFTAAGLNFDGIYSQGNAVATHANSMNVANLITVVAWVRQANTTDNKVIVAKNDTGYTRGFELYLVNGQPLVYMRPATANNNLYVGPALANNKWHCVAFTYDGVNIRGYSNGEFKAVSTGIANAATDTSSNLYIGARIGVTPYIFEGQIGSIEIYNRVLSNNEILNVYNTTRRIYGV